MNCLVFFISIWIIFQGYSLANEKTPHEIIKELSTKADTLDSAGLIQLGKAYSETENPMAAIKTFSLALSKKEKNFEAKTLIGREYLNLKKEREALSALRDALDYNPKYELAYLEIERLYERKGNKYELRTLYLDMIEHLGEKSEYLARLCEISYSSGLYESATSHCRRGIVLNKDEPKNYVFLALTFKETGRLPEANSLLKRAADNFTKSFEAQMAYANLLEDQKNYIESQKYYRHASEINPTSLKALVGFASTTVELQKFDEGLLLYKKACKINKNATINLRKSIVSLKGFKAGLFISKYEDLADTCGIEP